MGLWLEGTLFRLAQKTQLISYPTSPLGWFGPFGAICSERIQGSLEIEGTAHKQVAYAVLAEEAGFFNRLLLR